MAALAFSAVLFAGGRSTRMGRDKALLKLDGEPLWQRQITLLRALQPREILISGNAMGFPAESSADCAVVPDAITGLGPLGGLDTVLRRACCEQVLILAIDLPQMRVDLLARLLQEAAETGRGVIPRTSHGLEPLAAVYPRACQPLVSAVLAAGERSMQAFVQRALAEHLLVEWTVEATDEGAFFNVNTAVEWEVFRRTPLFDG